MNNVITIATWNINSVRLRLPLIKKIVQEKNPDILCLQEIKCADEKFPVDDIKQLGFEHIAIRGQKSHHGVATLSRHPIKNSNIKNFCQKDDARHVEVTVNFGGKNIRIHNFYVPSGGDEPDRKVNEKFGHKLDFLDEMADWLTGPETDSPSILVGDLNVAPYENDVWSHKQLLNVVSHTPVEVERLEKVYKAGNWLDSSRKFVPLSEKLYSWWSYRSKDWSLSDRGRRLDHIWITPHLESNLTSSNVVRDARGWDKPSDHAPVIAEFSF